MIPKISSRARARRPVMLDADHVSCADCPARGAGLCARISDTCREGVNQLARQARLAKGEILAEEGARGHEIISVMAGVVELSKSVAEDRHAIVGFRFPGELIAPYRNAFTWPMTVRALLPCRVCRVNCEGLRRLSPTYPEIDSALLETAMEEIEDGLEHVVTVGHKRVDERVASFILEMSRRMAWGERARSTIEIPVTRPQMADYLGLRTETVCRALTRLRTQGIVSLSSPKRLVILDQDRLAALASGAEPEAANPTSGQKQA